jgi:uncharacterized protein DUF4349
MRTQRRIMEAMAVLIFVAVIVIGVLAMTGPAVGNVFSSLVNGMPGPGYNPASLQSGGDSDAMRLVNNAQQGNTTQSNQTQQRVILRNASLTLDVADPEAKMHDIGSMAGEMGGWVVNSSTNKTTRYGQDAIQASITVRVPAERLDEAMGRIKEGAGSVESENVTGQDVTQQYVDLTSRLKNLQDAADHLQQIMDAAQNTADVLAAYGQLVDLRGQIESLQGQIQYFDQSAAFSSIQVTLLPQVDDSSLQIGGWHPLRTLRDAVQLLVNVLIFVANALIVLIVVALPLALAVGVPALYLRRWIRRRRAKTAVPVMPLSPHDEA